MSRAAASAIMGLLLAAVSAVAVAVEIRVASFNIGAHFGETYFDYSLGDPGTTDHESVRDILQRIGADVVALQEIHSADLEGSPNDLQALAASLGYPHQYVAPLTNAFDTTFRTVFLSRFPFLSTASIGSPEGAKEITRLHPVVRVDVPGIDNDPLLISPHLKAGTSSADRFRRAVEMRRLTGFLTSTGTVDDDNFIILGDFNPSSINKTFTEAPTGLPTNFALGSDIAFPVSYQVNPVAYFLTPAAVRLEALQLDGSPSTYNTTTSGGPALDLILVSPAIAARDFATEIYNSALDTNGNGLPKAGSPLAISTSATASDHYAVFADLELDPPEPYVFTQPGESVVEGFDGFAGSRAPSPWIAGGGAWLGTDTGSSKLPGWRSYGAAPGFLAAGAPAAISAKFENRSQTPLTALEISLDAEQWRAVSGGAADRMAVELVTAAGTISLPGLGFTASQALPTGPVPGGAAVRLSAIASGLWIPPGESFELRVSFVPGEGGGPAPDDVFINEFHYDNTGADADEFVEIAVGPGFSGSLSDVSLVLYNGGNGATNGTHKLSTFTPGVITDSGHRLFHKPILSGLQNDMEAFAIIAGSTVLHFISYEGSFIATGGPALDLTSTDIGVSQQPAAPAGESALGLSGNGGFSGDFSWTKFSGIVHSPGAPNAGQTFTNPNLPPQGLAFDDLAVLFLTDDDLDGTPDLTDPDDDNDGQSDADEIAFGTDPLDSADRFAPVITRSAAGLELSFPGAEGIDYTVEWSELLEDWQDLSTVTGEGEVVVVPLPMAEPRMFFRVRAGEASP